MLSSIGTCATAHNPKEGQPGSGRRHRLHCWHCSEQLRITGAGGPPWARRPCERCRSCVTTQARACKGTQELTAKLGTDSHTFVAILAVGHPPVFWVLLRCVKQVSEIGAVQTPPPRVQAPSHPTPSLHPSQCLSASAGPSENQKSCSRPVSTERLGLSAKPGRKQSKSPCSAPTPYLTEENHVYDTTNLLAPARPFRTCPPQR